MPQEARKHSFWDVALVWAAQDVGKGVASRKCWAALRPRRMGLSVGFRHSSAEAASVLGEVCAGAGRAVYESREFDQVTR